MVATSTNPMIITGATQLLETGASKLNCIFVEINEIQFDYKYLHFDWYFITQYNFYITICHAV